MCLLDEWKRNNMLRMDKVKIKKMSLRIQRSMSADFFFFAYRSPFLKQEATHPPQKIKPKSKMTQKLPRHCDFDSSSPQRQDVLCALENYHKSRFGKFALIFFASSAARFHLMVGLEEFSQSSAN